MNIFSTNPLDVCDTGIMLKKGQVELKVWLDKNFSEIRMDKKLQCVEKSLLKKLHNVVKLVKIQN